MIGFKKKVKEENKEYKTILNLLQKSKEDEVEISLPLRAFVMFEEISGKNYSSAMNSNEDSLILMYCAFVCSTGIQVNIESFVGMLENQRFARKIEKDLNRLQRFNDQFKKKTEEKEESESGQTAELSITEMVNKLIFTYGLDSDFVLNKMQLWEVNHFLEGAEAAYKEHIEEQRLWTFLQVAPQIDLKKCNSPEKLLPLPWTKEKDKKNRANALADEKERAKSTIGMTIEL